MENLKTVNIKGKEYVEVNERIRYFRTSPEFKDWRLITELVSISEDSVLMKASVFDTEGIVRATGYARECRSDNFINGTSYVENCETSAWGRALGNLGIGITKSIASAEEVTNAINNQPQQQNEERKIFQHEWEGKVYEVPYIKKFSKAKNKYFWLLEDEANGVFFPKFMNYEG